MTDAKSKGQASARRPKKPKASAAFGKLNALSASGALSQINSPAPAPAREPASGTAESVPAEAPSEDVTSTAAAETEPVSLPSPPAEPEATFVQEEGGPTAEALGGAWDSSAPAPAPESSISAPASDATTEDSAEAGPADERGLPEESSIPAQSEAPTGAASPLANVTHANQQLLGQQPEAAGPQPPSQPAGEVAVRRNVGPAFPVTSGYSEQRMLEALPPQLAEKVQGLPVAYRELAKSYRQAQATRTGNKPAKRNIRLHADVATAVNRQMVSDKRMLGLRNLKPSQYVDAAITLARNASIDDLIQAADHFRDSRLGEEGGSATPNHYSISRENDDWLDDTMDELLLANTTGLHGHMINVIIQSFLEQLKQEAPTPAT
ncbi:hypothetical protein [Streptomyces sp. NBC_00470]|uniref:hypothetical protein n=1 Tax=Streptomyces sp. NBC_00470 TaxID=2975753 RepID=UPI002F90E4C8